MSPPSRGRAADYLLGPARTTYLTLLPSIGVVVGVVVRVRACVSASAGDAYVLT